MRRHIRCGTLFIGTEDGAHADQSTVIDGTPPQDVRVLQDRARIPEIFLDGCRLALAEDGQAQAARYVEQHVERHRYAGRVAQTEGERPTPRQVLKAV